MKILNSGTGISVEISRKTDRTLYNELHPPHTASWDRIIILHAILNDEL